MRQPFITALSLLIACLFSAATRTATAQTPPAAPANTVAAETLLDLPGSGTDTDAIDYARLPVLKGAHAVVSPVDPEWKFQLHNYLLHHDGQYWCTWSHGPSEDSPTQHIRYATSPDGLKWSAPKILVGVPEPGYAYIARGFWLRDGELLALVAHYKGQGAFGVDKELKLEAYVWDKAADAWKFRSLVYDNTINNFSPEKLPTGEWMMTRREARFSTSMMIGGIKSIDDWKIVPIWDFFASLKARDKFKSDEPIWYPADDKTLVALFRDNGGSSRIFRSVSTDNAQTWSTQAKTNFPNATSKLFSMKTSTGLRILINNANPALGRRQLFLSVSDDGLVFNRMFLLDIPAQAKPSTLQYPHAIERDGQLLIAYSRNKAMIELLKIDLGDLARR